MEALKFHMLVSGNKIVCLYNDGHTITNSPNGVGWCSAKTCN